MTTTNQESGVGFKRRPMYSGQQHIDAQLEETPTPDAGPDANPNSDDPGRELTPEEKTYAKRYADLRRETQRRDQAYKDSLAQLQVEISTLKQGGQALPVNEAEIKDWMSKYPDLASAILHLADKTASEKFQTIKSKMERLEEESLEVKREKAFLELKQLHPDVEEIRSSEEFHEWVEEQPADIQGWFYENDTDARLAARGISLFKSETGWRKARKAKDPRQERMDASRNIDTSNAPNINAEGAGGKKQWRESDIKKLSPKQFEQFEEEIETAMREGRIIHDLQASRQ